MNLNIIYDANSHIDSPVGVINLFARGTKLVGLTMGGEAQQAAGKASVLTEAGKQLTEYFDGKRKTFKLDYELDGTEFQKSVWKQIAKTGFGKVITYGEIAAKIGNPQAARAIGGAVGQNPVPLIVGCHRVLGSNGRITGYSGGNGLVTKWQLLELEGIEARD